MTKYDWILEATEGIDSHAVGRLWKELGDHYQAAYDAQIARSASPDAAEQAALSSLGDPYAANRAYRKEFPPAYIRISKVLVLVTTIEAILATVVFFLLSADVRHAHSHLFPRILSLANYVLLSLTNLAGYAKSRKLAFVNRIPSWIVPEKPSLVGFAGAALVTTFAVLRFVLTP